MQSDWLLASPGSCSHFCLKQCFASKGCIVLACFFFESWQVEAV